MPINTNPVLRSDIWRSWIKSVERGKLHTGYAAPLMKYPQTCYSFSGAFLIKNAHREGRGRRLLPQGDEVVEGWQVPVWSEPRPWTLHRVLNQGQSMDMDRFPSLSGARKKHKKRARKAAVICKLSQHILQGRRTRTTGIWTQKHSSRNYLVDVDSVLHVLSCLN